MGKGAYHHGLVIKKYRELREWSQEQLAEQWPCSDGSRGVGTRYIRRVETGERIISDTEILRQLSDLLDIPLWEFGLSLYNPFKPESLPGHGRRLYNETLDIVEALINQSLILWRSMPLPVAERAMQPLSAFFEAFERHGTLTLFQRFHTLYAHYRTIRGLFYFERRDYAKALKIYESVYKDAESLDDPVLQVHCLVVLGGAYKQAGKCPDAIDALEKARDFSFSTSKQLAAYTNAFLAHAYAASDDMKRFERTINTAITIADRLKDGYGDGTDFVHQNMNDILVLRSSGYLALSRPQKALDLLPNHGDKQYIYRARALLMLNEVEECIDALRLAYRAIAISQSPHRSDDITELLRAIDDAGYGNLLKVKQFKEELRET